MIPEQAVLLRIFVGESDRMEGRPIYEWLVKQARRQGLAGATVLRGMMGFGAHSRIIHSLKAERLSEDLPILVEMVDSPEKIEAFLHFAGQNIKRGLLATTQDVRVRIYRGGELGR